MVTKVINASETITKKIIGIQDLSANTMDLSHVVNTTENSRKTNSRNTHETIATMNADISALDMTESLTDTKTEANTEAIDDRTDTTEIEDLI